MLCECKGETVMPHAGASRRRPTADAPAEGGVLIPVDPLPPCITNVSIRAEGLGNFVCACVPAGILPHRTVRATRAPSLAFALRK